MKKFFSVLVLTSTVALGQQPTINSGGILNAASYSQDIAQGSTFILFGTKLGPERLVQASRYPLDTNLGGTTVTVSDGTTAVAVPLVYSSAQQVAAIMPSTTRVGPVSVRVSFGGQTSAAYSAPVVKSRVGIFTTNSQGSGQVVAQNYRSQNDMPVNGSAEPANPGQYVILWATGLGPSSGSDVMPPQPSNLDVDLRLFLGDQEAKLTYKGRSGCCAGIDQIILQVPAKVEGCAVPIHILTAGDWLAQQPTLAISPTGQKCSAAGKASETYNNHGFAFQYSVDLRLVEQKIQDAYNSDGIQMLDLANEAVYFAIHRNAPKDGLADQAHLSFVDEMRILALTGSKVTYESRGFERIDRAGGVTYRTKMQTLESRFDPSADPQTIYITTFCCDAGHFVGFVYPETPINWNAAELALTTLEFTGRKTADLLSAHWFQPGMSLVFEATGSIYLSSYPPGAFARSGSYRISAAKELMIQWVKGDTLPAETETCTFSVTPAALTVACPKTAGMSGAWKR